MRNFITIVILFFAASSSAQSFFSKVFPHQEPPYFAPIAFGIGNPIVRTSDSGYMLNYCYYPQTLESLSSALTQLVRTDATLTPKWRLDFLGLNAQTIPLDNGACLVWGAQIGYTHAEKIDSSGNVIWTKYIMWDNADGFAAEAAVYTGSKIRFAGYTFVDGLPFYSQTTPLIVDIDTAGNVIGSKTLPTLSTSTPLSLFNSITLDAAGNYVFTGTASGLPFIMKMSSTDVILWSKEFNTSYAVPQINSTLTLSSGSVIFGGKYYVMTGAGYLPMYGKLSSTGSLMWAKQIDTSLGYKFNFQQLPNGNILASEGAHLMEMDTTGNILWSKHLGGKINVISPAYFKSANNWYFASITKDSFSKVIFNTDSNGIGHCTSTNDTLLPNNVILTIADRPGSFGTTSFHAMAALPDTAKMQPYYDTCAGYFPLLPPAAVVNYNSTANIHIELFPNPASSLLNVTCRNKVTSIAISNVLGKVVLNPYCNDKTTQIDVSNLPAGTYFLKINNVEVRRFVKE